MAGEGSVLHMIKSLKANRSLLKKRKPMTSGKMEKKPLIDHKEFTSEAKKVYYTKLAEEKASNWKKMIVAGGLTLVGLVVFISGLIYWMRMVFDF